MANHPKDNAVDLKIDSEFEKDVFEMTGVLYIYCEGGKSIPFYEQLFMQNLKINCIVVNGGSCSKIQTEVKNRCHLGIETIGVIDGDYETKFVDNIFQIDYYSIENLVLIYHEQFIDLKNIITESYYAKFRKEGLKHRVKLSNQRDNLQVDDNKILKDSEVEYLNGKIDSLTGFIKYVDFKVCVLQYVEGVSNDRGIERHYKKQIKKYLEDLHRHHRSADLAFMFDDVTADKLWHKLESHRRN